MKSPLISPRITAITAPLGLLAIAAATLIPIYQGSFSYSALSRWLYTIGAAVLLLSRLFGSVSVADLRLRRLYRIESWSAIFFCVAAFFMWYPEGSPRDWLAFTLAGAAIQIYTSFAIPARQRKVKNGQ